MTQDDINPEYDDYKLEENLNIIKSFQGYLNEIIISIETNRCHSETISKLSDLISEYFNQINENDSG